MSHELKVPPTNTRELQCFLWAVDDHIMKWFDVSDAGGKKYGAIRATGKFEGNFDYSRGLMMMHIETSINHKFAPKGKSKDEKYVDTYQTIVSITNVDDGIWNAYSKEFSSMAEADELTDKLYLAYQEFENDNYGKSLPTEKELNGFLVIHGLWGEFTG